MWGSGEEHSLPFLEVLLIRERMDYLITPLTHSSRRELAGGTKQNRFHPQLLCSMLGSLDQLTSNSLASIAAENA